MKMNINQLKQKSIVDIRHFVVKNWDSLSSNQLFFLTALVRKKQAENAIVAGKLANNSLFTMAEDYLIKQKIAYDFNDIIDVAYKIRKGIDKRTKNKNIDINKIMMTNKESRREKYLRTGK